VKNVLFVGDHPLGVTGNANMMAALLEQVDRNNYIPAIFSPYPPPIRNKVFEDKLPNYNVTIARDERDFGGKDLINFVQHNELDVLVIVGVDIWMYAHVYDALMQLAELRGMKTICIMPYDLPEIRADFAKWFSVFDFPCVYSKYGYHTLKPYVPELRYFRPPVNDYEVFRIYSPEEKIAVRHQLFPELSDERFLFGFIGPNQFRKDPQRAIKAFFEVKKQNPNVTLYLHTDMTTGVYNLEQTLNDYAAVYGAKTGDVVAKKPNIFYDRKRMVDIYNSLNCLVNTSTHEGLSWTILEAQLCGCPVVASNTTAQIELLADGAGLPVDCHELTYVPIIAQRGRTFVESVCCSFSDLVDKMDKIVRDDRLRRDIIKKGAKAARQWMERSSNINKLLDEATEPGIKVGPPKINKVLFAQHSSGGDVLMSTQCFKGIKERHPDVPLVYMTQDMYRDIVEGNPYVDEIISWNDSMLGKYQIVYNPHGEKILPGGWNNLDVPLHSMYPYFCQVEPDNMFIKLEKPEIELPDEYIVVQTAGAQKQYRTYRHMDVVIQMMPQYKFVQLGMGKDLACRRTVLDLREKLTWRQSAWVMKNARAAVVIDSFLSHLAGALGTPAIVLYGPAPARVTGPRSDNGTIINLEPNKLDVCPITANCWGQPGKAPCMSPCISTINPMLVVKELTKLLQPKGAFGI